MTNMVPDARPGARPGALPSALIDDLVDGLRPVRRIRARDAWLVTGGLCVAAAIGLGTLQGFRADILAGHPAAIVLLRAGMLALLGFAALGAALASARPAIGGAANGWRWALGAAALFPLVTLLMAVRDTALPMAELTARTGPWCLMIGGGFGLTIAGAMALWLRRGASMRPERTGMLTGLGAGAFGTLIFSLSCVSNSIAYIGIWYTGSILISTLAGRLLIPPMLRW